jgi:membrane protein YqaA with SNARE-associated domain
LLRAFTTALIAFGPWGVFLLGAIDSLGIPLPAAMDALILAVSIKTPDRAWFTAAMAVLGSAGGNMVLFLAARYGARRFVNAEAPPGRRHKFQKWFHRYGMLSVFVPAVTPIVPLPLKVFVASAGALHTPVSKFLAVILVARVIRYFGEAWLGVCLGQGAQAFLAHNAWLLAVVALMITVVVAGLIRMARPPADPAA